VTGREALKAIRDRFDGIMDDYRHTVYLYIGHVQIIWRCDKGYVVAYPIPRARFIDLQLDIWSLVRPKWPGRTV
jgi:hypothetical protein